MPGQVQPVTFYVPASSAQPMDVRVAHSGLRMVLVPRSGLRLLDDSWDVLGVYFLLGPSDGSPDRYRAYVGEVSKRTLLMRMGEHATEKAWWNRALLITSASDDLNSAEIGWLEGRLYDVLNNAVAVELMNGNRPGDNSLPMQERDVLERYVEPVMSALRACGASPDTADQLPPEPASRRKRHYTESVGDLIAAGLLKAGTVLQPLRSELTQTATVRPDGSLAVGDVIYSAVSPAAMAVSGNKSEPGWDFWGAPSGDGSHVPLARLRERLREGKTVIKTETSTHLSASPAVAVAPASESNDSETAPATTDLTEGSAPRRAPRQFTETVADLLQAGLLHPGEALQSVRKALPDARARVLPDGKLEVDGTEYGSLSQSAKAVSGNKAEPGWEFWAAERDGHLVRLYDLREQLRDASTPQDAVSQ
jgi:Restriction Enzyme Adenine Methylase Associated